MSPDVAHSTTSLEPAIAHPQISAVPVQQNQAIKLSFPFRSLVSEAEKWDLSELFINEASWQKEYIELRNSLKVLESFKGNIGTASSLLGLLNCSESLAQRYARLDMYVRLLLDTDTNDQVASKLCGTMDAFSGDYEEAMAFINPEILELGWERVRDYMRESPDLELRRQSLGDLFRQARLTRSTEIEKVLGAASSHLNGPANTYLTLVDASMEFPTAVVRDKTYPVTPANYEDLLSSPDRELRFQSWISTFGQYFKFRDTFAALYSNAIQCNMFMARQRGLTDAIEHALVEENIPREVSDRAVFGCKDFLPAWQTYFNLKSKIIGVQSFKHWDIFAPTSGVEERIPYSTAQKLVLESLAPLGTDYVDRLSLGLKEQRWVDVYPTPGKRSGAYSYTGFKTVPYILLNYTGSMVEASTLAHEAGHSMHSVMSWEAQAYPDHEFSLFNTEIASIVNQLLFSSYALEQSKSREQKLAVIESMLYPMHRYLAVMPMLSQVEEFAVATIAAGEGITADMLSDKMLESMQQFYGNSVDLSCKDSQFAGELWATFSHLYTPGYVRMYSCGILAACQITQDLLAGVPGTQQRYLQFLRAGSSKYSLELLNDLGVDFMSSKPFDAAAQVFHNYNSRLAELV